MNVRLLAAMLGIPLYSYQERMLDTLERGRVVVADGCRHSRGKRPAPGEIRGVKATTVIVDECPLAP